MKKLFAISAFLFIAAGFLFAQSDDDLFGSDDDFFGDDGIDVVESVTAKSDLSKGSLFENGSIKIGGSFNTSIATNTIAWADDGKDFGYHLWKTTLTPTANALLSVDARPSQTLRMYTKFGLNYPFSVKGLTTSQTTVFQNPLSKVVMGAVTVSNTTIADWLLLKELFTDFSLKDTAFFRFGIHTVTWGTGYFFSPVSDLVNASSINPEDTSAQVDGVLNLRTQIVFPGSQNCLWLYVIPSTKINTGTTAESYIRDTALAGKMEMVFGGWEFGLGGYWKYQNAPKAMLTASGSLKNVSLFGEFVYRYGSNREWEQARSDWNENTAWSAKTSLFQATVGLSRYWKDPAITAAVQYYFDGNWMDNLYENKELGIKIPSVTYGHNVAGILSFGRIFGTTNLKATVFGMVNFGKNEMDSKLKSSLTSYGYSTTYFNSATFSAMLNYSPINEITIGAGPYVTFEAWDKCPVVSVKLNFTLGGGKF